MGTKRGAGGIQDGRESTCGALMWNGTRKIFKGGGIFDAAHFKNKGNALPELKTAASLGEQVFFYLWTKGVYAVFFSAVLNLSVRVLF